MLWNIRCISLDPRWQSFRQHFIKSLQWTLVEAHLLKLQLLSLVLLQCFLNLGQPQPSCLLSLLHFGLLVPRIRILLDKVEQPRHSIKSKLFPYFCLVAFADSQFFPWLARDYSRKSFFDVSDVK